MVASRESQKLDLHDITLNSLKPSDIICPSCYDIIELIIEPEERLAIERVRCPDCLEWIDV